MKTSSGMVPMGIPVLSPYSVGNRSWYWHCLFKIQSLCAIFSLFYKFSVSYKKVYYFLDDLPTFVLLQVHCHFLDLASPEKYIRISLSFSFLQFYKWFADLEAAMKSEVTLVFILFSWIPWLTILLYAIKVLFFFFRPKRNISIMWGL